MPMQPLRPSQLVLLALWLALAACSAPTSPPATPAPTNATITFALPAGQGTLARPATTCLVVARPDGSRLHDGPTAGTAVDGRATFPAGTTAAAIVAHYAALLQRHGWIEGTHFTAAGNSLHLYGITELAAGTDGAQLGVSGATDSDAIPFRTVAPRAR